MSPICSTSQTKKRETGKSEMVIDLNKTYKHFEERNLASEGKKMDTKKITNSVPDFITVQFAVV
jgi:hypothetical protein